jgi:hypothetical protein
MLRLPGEVCCPSPVLFVALLLIVILQTACGGGSSSGNSTTVGQQFPVPPTVTYPPIQNGGSLQVTGFSSSQTTAINLLIAGLPKADLQGLTAVNSASATTGNLAGTLTISNGVITIYQGSSALDNPTLFLALLSGIGQNVYTLLNAADQANIQHDLPFANQFYALVGSATVATPAELFGNNYAYYILRIPAYLVHGTIGIGDVFSMLSNSFFGQGQLPDGTGGVVNIPGDDSWVMDEPLQVAARFFGGLNSFGDAFTYGLGVDLSTGNVTSSTSLLNTHGVPQPFPQLIFGGIFNVTKGRVVSVLGVPSTITLPYPVSLPSVIKPYFM